MLGWVIAAFGNALELETRIIQISNGTDSAVPAYVMPRYADGDVLKQSSHYLLDNANSMLLNDSQVAAQFIKRYSRPIQDSPGKDFCDNVAGIDNMPDCDGCAAKLDSSDEPHWSPERVRLETLLTQRRGAFELFFAM